MTYFEQIGGGPRLSAIIDEFVEHICSDMMIGFLFAQVDKARLKRMEFEHAAAFLGATAPYTGRELGAAHARHPILGGHFARRRTILEQTLERHGVAPAIRDAWLAHQDALRSEVVRGDSTECTDERYLGTSPSGASQSQPGEPGHSERGERKT